MGVRTFWTPILAIVDLELVPKIHDMNLSDTSRFRLAQILGAV